MLIEFRGKPENRVAAVFIHGFTGDAAGTWTRIPEFLGADPKLAGFDLFGFGYTSTRGFDLIGLWSADPRIEEISVALRGDLAARNMRRYNAVALIAHSMGGLVAQLALLDDEALLLRTTHLALLGAPSGGLHKARLFSFWKRQISNMNATGPFIADLRRRWTERGFDQPGFRFMAYAGDSDQFVPPESSLTPFPESFRGVVPGNHITMLRATSPDHVTVQRLSDFLSGKGTAEGARSAARLALEMRDFNQVIHAYGSRPETLDAGAAVQLAIALDGVGRRDDAIAALTSHAAAGTDAMGTLAGRLKRTWLVSRQRADAERALELYQQAYDLSLAKQPPDHNQAFYHGTNIAFLLLAFRNDPLAAQSMAAKVLDHCAAATCPPAERHWLRATEGDALMLLGRIEESLEKHREAGRLSRLEPWQALSIQEQAVRLADLCGVEEGVIRDLAAIYQPEATDAAAH